MTVNRKFIDSLRPQEAIFYLEYEATESLAGNVWFVNNSDEILTEVSIDSFGFATTDDDVLTTMHTPNPKVYKNVEPSEAILIDKYDCMFDSDFMIQFGVYVTSSSYGEKEYYSSKLTKGGDSNATLLWKPLPHEIPDPDNPATPLSPEKAAFEYINRTGCFLGKSVSLNRGDLRMDYAAERLAPSGIVLEKFTHRNGNIIEYKFSEASGTVLFRTCNFVNACVFVESLRK